MSADLRRFSIEVSPYAERDLAKLPNGIARLILEEIRAQRHSRLARILNGDPSASPTRRRAQTWCSLFVGSFPQGRVDEDAHV